MIVKIILILIFLVLSALTSGCEVAFFSLDKSIMPNDKSDKLIKKIQLLLEQPKKLLATILISNNFINIAIVILFASIDNPYLSSLNSPFLETVLEVGLIGMLILFIGDILPKIYANRNPLVFSKIMVNPIYFLDRYVLFLLNKPMSKSMSYLESSLAKDSKQLSVDKLSQALDLTDSKETSKEEKKILKGIVNFGNVETRQIMCPRIDVFALESNKKILDVIDDLIAKGFSRVPVYKENLDKIIGVLYVKDLLPHLENDNFNWTSLLRKPLYIPENKKLDDLLTEFKTKKIHMGIVVDEYGGTSGIITLEDVIEEIFGEISGEFDEEDNLFSKLDDFTFIFDSKINLQDFYRAINLKDSTSFEEIALEIETLGGFLIEKVKKIPRVGQVIIHDSYKFIVEIVDKKRIKQVKLIIPKDK
ncbi:gliding motility-associated protein GldE [Flavobacteriaceae bacterium]|nr:gliding motility-associated protein GldE [Flavobacteriaceae bacterium]MDA8630682.1 gliding motility-associated protein GldE [Flavobacteriaceae bacterium]MDA9850604.1 gliding motility-associated protein GldE [Flavobacteriaceae bacterium]MDB2366001.1 gliding motility-associated protein GldE [Flavobacteriaceae bacterium]MDC0560083.1 gliding motility-associated protein GldE [Flavobacteriaceae bacterium]